MAIEMTIKPAANRKGNGVVLYGFNEPGNLQKWFERWYKDEAAARKYAAKRNWNVTVK